MAFSLHIRCDQCGRALNSMSGDRLVLSRWNEAEDREVLVCSEDCRTAALDDERWTNQPPGDTLGV